MEKSRWCSGARSLKGEDRFPAGPRALLRWFQVEETDEVE